MTNPTPEPETVPAAPTGSTSAASAKKAKDGKEYVRYTGTAHVREITARDWRRAGVKEGKTVRWDASNGHRVPVEELDFLDDDQFNRYIKSDASLKEVTEAE
jgi:hypothetical protein